MPPIKSISVLRSQPVRRNAQMFSRSALLCEGPCWRLDTSSPNIVKPAMFAPGYHLLKADLASAVCDRNTHDLDLRLRGVGRMRPGFSQLIQRAFYHISGHLCPSELVLPESRLKLHILSHLPWAVPLLAGALARFFLLSSSYSFAASPRVSQPPSEKISYNLSVGKSPDI